MKSKENTLLSSPTSLFDSNIKLEDSNTGINSDINVSPNLKNNSKENNIKNIITNRITTNDTTNQITKDIIKEEEISTPLKINSSKNKENKEQEKKEEIIKKDPIITKVKLIKFYPKADTKSINFNKLELVKKTINSVRNGCNQNNKRFKNNNLEQNKKINNNSNILNYNLNITNNDKNSLNIDNLLNNYKKILKDLENKDNKIKLKIDYNENFEDININNSISNDKKENINQKIIEESLKIINDGNTKKTSLFRKSKSKPNIKDYLLSERINKKESVNKENFSPELIEIISKENENLKKENKLLNNEIIKLHECIQEQNSKIQNYKNSIKINEEQIKYLLTIKESNNISLKDKDNIINEMKNKIFSLQKEIINNKEEINSLNEIINLNKKEINSKESNFEKNENEIEINEELQNLKILLSEKNNIIENLKNNFRIDDEEKEEYNELNKLNLILQEEINELKKSLKIKDKELNYMEMESKKIYVNLDIIKKDYEILYQKYIEQNNIIDQFIKNNNIINADNIENNDNKEINSSINFDYNDINKKELEKKIENENSKKYNNLFFEKNNKSCENRLLNNKMNTFYKYGNETPKNFKKINLEINSEINNDNLNIFKSINKKRYLTPNRLYNISYNNNFNALDNFSIEENNNNFTSNNFYNNYEERNKYDQLLNNNINNATQLITSYNENNNCIKYLPDIHFSENAINNYPNIYTLVGTKIIGFNLKKKKFMLIKQIDNTNNLFNDNIDILRKNNILPTTLNNSLGFIILLNNYLFIYSPVNNTLNLCAKISTNHWNGGFIGINNNLYIISGIDTTICELYSLDSKKIFNLPFVNYKRINCGICNVNNEYIYTLFGQNSDNSIERLNIMKNLEGEKNWELIRLKIEVGKNIYLNNLKQFLAFYDDDNIIILGGYYQVKNENQEILKLNISDNCLKKIGVINLKSLYSSQITFIDDELFTAYDINNSLHFFNKDLDQHLIFNFQI